MMIALCALSALVAFCVAVAADFFARQKWMASNNRLRVQCDRYVSELGPLRQEAVRLDSLAAALEARLGEAEKHVAAVSQQLDEARVHAECHRRAAGVHCERADVLRRERDQAREIAQEVMAERDSFRDQAAAFEDDNGRLRQQLEEARRHEAEAEQGWKECEERFTSLDAVLAQVAAERDQAVAGLQATSAQTLALSTELGRERVRAAKVADELAALAESLRRRPE